MLVQPMEKQQSAFRRWKNLNDFGGVPPNLRAFNGLFQIQRLGKTARIGNNVDELGQNLRRERKIVTGFDKFLELRTGAGMFRVRTDFDRDKKLGVNAVSHSTFLQANRHGWSKDEAFCRD